MEQEEIEKAGKIYTAQTNENYVLGDEDIKYAFIAGANWRINSVWHDASEKPEHSDRYILVDSVSYDGIRCYNVIRAMDYDKHPFNECWAYIEELTPNK